MLEVKAPEDHLFLFWRWPQHDIASVLEPLQRRFTIKRVVRLTWATERIEENLRRFYSWEPGQPELVEKMKSAGDLPFLLVVVRDPAPRYGYRRGVDYGIKYVNVNTCDLKHHWRTGSVSVHATNNPQEFRFSLMMLAGQRAEEMADAAEWDGRIEELHRDVTGSRGWRDLAEIFEVLNETANYLVLRNFEGLPAEYAQGPHDDIDMLVEDAVEKNRVMGILNARSGARVVVGGRDIEFDIWSPFDYFYDPNWCRQMLRDRVFVRGFYANGPRHYFFSLLYHGHVHPQELAPDYVPRLLALAKENDLPFVTEDMIRDPEQASVLLKDFLTVNFLGLTRPFGVTINEKFLTRLQGVPMLSQTGQLTLHAPTPPPDSSHASENAELARRLDELRNATSSRRWLLKALLGRLTEYPGDLMRRMLAR